MGPRRYWMLYTALGAALLVGGAVWLSQPASPPPPPIPAASAITPAVFADLSRHLPGLRGQPRAEVLDALSAALEAQPVAMVDALDLRTPQALRHYAAAMVAAGRTADLGRQAFVVLRGGDPQASPLTALAVAEGRDGDLWYPLADAAGAFVGEIGAAIAQARDRQENFAALALALGAAPPHDPDGLYQWLFDAATVEGGERLQSGALYWFGLSYDKATKDSVLMR